MFLAHLAALGFRGGGIHALFLYIYIYMANMHDDSSQICECKDESVQLDVIFRHQIWFEQAPVWPQMFCISVNREVQTVFPKSIDLWETLKFTSPKGYRCFVTSVCFQTCITWKIDNKRFSIHICQGLCIFFCESKPSTHQSGFRKHMCQCIA